MPNGGLNGLNGLNGMTGMARGAGKTPRIALALLLAAVLAAGLALPVGAAAQPASYDYDDDDDGLIDVRTLAQLNAVRWDKDGDGDVAAGDAANYLLAFPSRDATAAGRMGCPSGACGGYELHSHLNFDTDSDGDVDSNDAYPNWDPLPDYAAAFNGNGYTISNMASSGAGDRGLFAHLKSGARVEALGMLNPAVSGEKAGGLVAWIEAGANVLACYVVGGSVVGTSANNANDVYAGGVAGVNNGYITTSYSTASVRTTSDDPSAGGFAGDVSGTIMNSYSIGAVSNTGRDTSGQGLAVGGFIGRYFGSHDAITNSYFNSETSGQTRGVGKFVSAPESVDGKTTAELQNPTERAGIYEHWIRTDFDGDGFPDYEWDLGTSSQYPALRYGGHDPYMQRGDYDRDDDGLIDVRTLAQLNAIRWDLDGDGAIDADASSSDTNRFNNDAWINGGASLGCPDTADAGEDPGPCLGYELMNDLDFDADGSGAVDSSDPYPNWTPIGDSDVEYSGEFKGNNNAVFNLKINSAASRVGFFGQASGTISGLGLVGADITATASRGASVGALAGYTTGVVRASYAAGAINHTGTGSRNYVGGLVGQASGAAIAASWAGADASTSGGASSYAGGLAGRVAGSAAITAAYATGNATATGAGGGAGGLIGSISSSAAVTASFAAGAVSAATAGGGAKGGLIASGSGSVTSSYWDATTTGVADDGDAAAPEGKTTSQLQTPAAYGDKSTDIYMNWNVNVDGAAGADDPWDFGAPNHYPRLKFDGMNLLAQLGDYDLDDDGLAEIYTLEQLNAIRWDLDGSGAADASVSVGDKARFYREAWINAPPSLGCPDTADADANPGPCLGYELANTIRFAPDNNRRSRMSIAPIGDAAAPYSGAFKGNNEIIYKLTIDSASNRVGLFGHASGTITGVALQDAYIKTGASAGVSAGALVGELSDTGKVRASYVIGEILHEGMGSFNDVGGLVGYNNGGTIAASWARARASTFAPSSAAGGLVGRNAGKIIAAYSTGVASADGYRGEAGGLVGRLDAAGEIWASYAIGPSYARGVNGVAGGLLGGSQRREPNVKYSYWNTGTTGIPDDPDSFMPEGIIPEALKVRRNAMRELVVYAGARADWNVDVDGNATLDDPWFTYNASGYPLLKFGGMSPVAQGSLANGAARNGDEIDYVYLDQPLHSSSRHRASRIDPTLDGNWRWQRSADGWNWSEIEERGFSYHPSVLDAGYYLRACVPVVPSAVTEWTSIACTHPYPKVRAVGPPDE